MPTVPPWPSPTAPQFVKSRQVNVRITPGQEAALKRFCVKNGITMQAAMAQALAGLIEGFNDQGTA